MTDCVLQSYSGCLGGECLLVRIEDWMKETRERKRTNERMHTESTMKRKMLEKREKQEERNRCFAGRSLLKFSMMIEACIQSAVVSPSWPRRRSRNGWDGSIAVTRDSYSGFEASD
jgi:hypothetical protein